jgi:hypothetical protein
LQAKLFFRIFASMKAEKIEDEETVFISVFNAEKKILSCYKKFIDTYFSTKRLLTHD